MNPERFWLLYDAKDASDRHAYEVIEQVSMLFAILTNFSGFVKQILILKNQLSLTVCVSVARLS